MRLVLAFLWGLCLMACQAPETETETETEKETGTEMLALLAARPGSVIYPARQVITMAEPAIAGAIAVREGRIIALGQKQALQAALPEARLDERFADKVILPGLIDPHVHMALSSLQYATPLTPPWPMSTPDGMVRGLPSRQAFLTRLAELVAAAPEAEPLIVYGYHDLVHGPLDRHDLDQLTTSRPLIVWHYSSHDFYLNTAALDWAGIVPDLHNSYEGIDLDEAGQLTGRVYEDAIPLLLARIGPILLAPDRLRRGLKGFSALLRSGGVTTVADLGYGIFGLPLEDANIRQNWVSVAHSGYRLYLVPEHRAFLAAFADERIEVIQAMISGQRPVPAPVLKQVKFFTDAAFYSQTMRISEPGYLSGQSAGTQGLWVLRPEALVPTIRPYWQAGFDVRIHSNGDAAQTASLAALEVLRQSAEDQRFIFEHAGLFSPQQVADAARLGAGISAASHYVFYLGQAYQAPLGAKRGQWISPLASLSEAGVPVTLHSDAPLAPPLPLLAASVHMQRAKDVPAYEALEAITLDAAYALGLEDEIGSLEIGKRADFTILYANPLETAAEDWPALKIWGVVLDGEPRPVHRK